MTAPTFPRVQHRLVAARRMLYALQQLSPEHLSNFVNGATLALPQVLATQGVMRSGPVTVIYHGPVTEKTDGPVEVYLPFSGELDIPDGLMERAEFEHREAYLPLTKAQFADPLFNVARRELEDYVRANGEALGALRQIDFGVWQESGPEDIVGELALPIRWLNQMRPGTRGRLFP